MTEALFKGRRVLWMPFELSWEKPEEGTTFCCSAMGAALDFFCEQHADPFSCADAMLIYNPVFDEYGIPVHDGGASYVLIRHCPWCGAALPESQRERWFDAMDALGLAEAESPPEVYLSARWRQDK